MKENVWKRIIGATIGIVIGVLPAAYINKTWGYNLPITIFVVSAPLSTILARAYGDPYPNP